MRIWRGLSSKFLPCGCLAGVYETYDGTIVGILDSKAATCMDAAHRSGKCVPIEWPDETPTPAPDAPSHRFARD